MHSTKKSVFLRTYLFTSTTHVHMKDIFTRAIVGIVFFAFIAYIAYLFQNNALIVQGEYSSSNTAMLIILAVVALYVLVVYSLYPISIKFSKATLFFIGIGLIFVGQYVLLDDVAKNVYLADLSKIIGVVLLILSPTNILVSQKIITKKQEEKMEIIEI